MGGHERSSILSSMAGKDKKRPRIDKNKSSKQDMVSELSGENVASVIIN